MEEERGGPYHAEVVQDLDLGTPSSSSRRGRGRLVDDPRHVSLLPFVLLLLWLLLLLLLFVVVLFVVLLFIEVPPDPQHSNSRSAGNLCTVGLAGWLLRMDYWTRLKLLLLLLLLLLFV